MLDSDMLNYNLSRLEDLTLRGYPFFEVDLTRFSHFIGYLKLHDMFSQGVAYCFGPSLFYFIQNSECARSLLRSAQGCISVGYLPLEHRKLCVFLTNYIKEFDYEKGLDNICS